MSGRREPWFHAIRWTVFPLLRVYFRWRFEGLEKIPAEGPVLIACNHASYLDPLVNSYAVVRGGRRPRFLAKRELFGVVGLGSAMRGTKQIPVARGTGDRSALDNAEKALSHGEVVVVYPEGTVTRRDDGLPMEGKTGTVRLALTAGVPIVPMVSWGSSPVWQKSGPGSLRPGRPVWVRVGDPLTLDADGSAVTDREAVEAYTKQLMATLTDLATDLRDRYPAAWRDR